MMKNNYFRRLIAASAFICPASTLLMSAGGVSGQDYPHKPLRIVTGEPGGANDFVARLIAQGISDPLGQQVIVDNRGTRAAEIVARAQPDGYTVLLAGGNFMIGPLLQKMPYDPLRDFSPVTLVGSTPNVLVVHPAVAANSVRELVALAKARPGALNYATGGIGSANHLAGELFKTMAGVDIVRVPYKGAGPAINELIGGQVQMMFPNAPAATPHVKSGRLKALAVTSSGPSALFPDLPTVAASGLPGYESGAIQVVCAPAGTAAARIRRLNQEIARFLARAEVKARFFSAGMEAAGSSPEQLAAVMKSELALWGKVIRNAGIRAE